MHWICSGGNISATMIQRAQTSRRTCISSMRVEYCFKYTCRVSTWILVRLSPRQGGRKQCEVFFWKWRRKHYLEITWDSALLSFPYDAHADFFRTTCMIAGMPVKTVFSMLRVKKSQLRPERHQVPGWDAACLVGRVGRATRWIDANAVHWLLFKEAKQ